MSSKRASHAAYLRKLADETVRERLARARDGVKAAQAHKRTATRRARETCAAARLATRAWIVKARRELAVEIEQLRGELRDRIAHKREAVRACCGPDRARVRAEADQQIDAKRAELEQLKDERRRERTWSKPDKRTPSQRRARVREQRQESEHDVTSDLSPDELVVWQAVRSKIPAGNDRISRLERFRHWLHEHQGEVIRILDDDAERQVNEAIEREQIERQEARAFKRGMHKATDRELRDYVAADLEAVPF
jgi:hypothetical protein